MPNRSPQKNAINQGFLDRLWESRNRIHVLLASGAILLLIALFDWWTTPFVSLGFLYLFPIMLAAGFLPRWAIALISVACAVLAEVFSELPRSVTRFSLEALALGSCGLFVAELVRNRRMALIAQDMLRGLVETSPAAIVTVNERGFIELANGAASELMAPRDGCLVGNPIAAFLPELHHALRWEEAPQFRASMQCHGHRGSGETSCGMCGSRPIAGMNPASLRLSETSPPPPTGPSGFL